MIGLVGLGQRGELARHGGPVKGASVDDGAADGRTVATDPLGQALDDDGSAVIRRTVQVRRGKRVVDDDRNVERLGRVHQRGHVSHVYQRISDGLHVPELGVLLRGGHKGVDVVIAHEGGLDSQVIKRVEQDVPRSAVEGV